jgi:deazaflavin-dependent oxidoreductase (nitroreductase family)
VPLPSSFGRFNRSVTNRVTRPLIGYFPHGAIVVHTGRRSGRVYRTPVLAFDDGRGYLIALTYGPDVDWLKNVMAAGSCGLDVRGAVVELVDPVLVDGVEARAGMSATVRWILDRVGVSRGVRLARAPAGSASTSG